MQQRDSDRGESVEIIQREMTALSRRSRATAARLHPELSLVSYTILSHANDTGGCRATDLATHYLLDKSTISRQISSLERLGLLERSSDPDDQRIQILHPSEHGQEVLHLAYERRQGMISDRLADWPLEDLHRFASYLHCYNLADCPDTSTPDETGDATTTYGSDKSPNDRGA